MNVHFVDKIRQDNNGERRIGICGNILGVCLNNLKNDKKWVLLKHKHMYCWMVTLSLKKNLQNTLSFAFKKCVCSVMTSIGW